MEVRINVKVNNYIEDLSRLQEETTVKWCDGKNPCYHSDICTDAKWFIFEANTIYNIFNTMRYSTRPESGYEREKFCENIIFESVDEFINKYFAHSDEEIMECDSFDILI